MQRVAMLWSLCLAVLIGGAWVVCPDGQCAASEFDRFGLAQAHAWRGELLDSIMPPLTWLGSLLLLVPLTLFAAGDLLRRGRQRAAGFILLALLSASALGHGVKLLVARPRPDHFSAWLPMPVDWSYPSAHAMQVAAAALALFLVFGNRRPVWGMLMGMMVLAVGLSRIYLQVHFPSDVIAGALAAVLWVGGLHALIFRQPGASSKEQQGRRTA